MSFFGRGGQKKGGPLRRHSLQKLSNRQHSALPFPHERAPKKTTAGKSNSGFFSGVESGGWKKEGGSYSKGGRKGRPRRKRNSPDSFRLTGRRTNGQGTEETELPFLRREEREEGGRRRGPTATSLYSPCPCVRASPSTSPPTLFRPGKLRGLLLRPPSSVPRPRHGLYPALLHGRRGCVWERWVYAGEGRGFQSVFLSPLFSRDVPAYERTNENPRRETVFAFHSRAAAAAHFDKQHKHFQRRRTYIGISGGSGF